MNWIIARDNIHGTTTVQYGLQEIVLPFHISVDDFSTPAEIARLIVKIHTAGFKDGRKAAEFDAEEQSYIDSMGEE